MDSEQLLLTRIYRNAAAGSRALETLLPKSRDPIRPVLRRQLSGYRRYERRAREQLRASSGRAPRESLTGRFSIPMGIALNTLTDRSSSHLAEITINGNTMGIIDMSRTLSHAPAGSAAAQLGRDLLAFEQESIQVLKPYL